MKKWMGILLAVTLLLAAGTVYAGVPSKSTSDVSKVSTVETATGVTVADNFVFEVTQDAEPVIQEIIKLFTFVNDPVSGKAPIEYFPPDIQAQVQANLPEGVDISKLEINEIVTLNEMNYDASYGDITCTFEFATQYQEGQKLFALIGIYSGLKDAAGDYLVEWFVLDAEALAGGQVSVLFTQDVLVQMQDAFAVAMAILSEPVTDLP